MAIDRRVGLDPTGGVMDERNDAEAAAFNSSGVEATPEAPAPPPTETPTVPPPGETPPPPSAPTTPNPAGGVPGTPVVPPAPPVPSFPVPPVPPPPIAVGIAGGPAQVGGPGGPGGGGPATFAQVGSSAAARYRTPFFATNRVQSGGGPVSPSRFGPGAPTLGGSAPAPVVDAFGGGGDPTGAPNSDEDLARLIARIAAGRGGQR